MLHAEERHFVRRRIKKLDSFTIVNRQAAATTAKPLASDSREVTRCRRGNRLLRLSFIRPAPRRMRLSALNSEPDEPRTTVRREFNDISLRTKQHSKTEESEEHQPEEHGWNRSDDAQHEPCHGHALS